jgi:hypothetical protein
MTQFRYLISYVIDGGQGFGRVDVALPTPLVSQQDVANIERDLREHFATPNVMVLSFSAYTDPQRPVSQP